MGGTADSQNEGPAIKAARAGRRAPNQHYHQIQGRRSHSTRYFCQFGHIDYCQTLPVGHRGVHQIYIKYFRPESVDRAIENADPRYGVRRSNPPVISGDQPLYRFHSVCRRNVSYHCYENHVRVCKWQVGQETLVHRECGRLVTRNDFDQHLKICNQTFDHVGFRRAPSLNETERSSTRPRSPSIQMEELTTHTAAVTLDSEYESDYHTSNLSQEEEEEVCSKNDI